MDSNSNAAKSSSSQGNGRNSMLEQLLSKRLDSIANIRETFPLAYFIILPFFFVKHAEKGPSRSCGGQTRSGI